MTDSVLLNEGAVMAPCLAYPRLLLVRGEGSFVWDVNGKRYLDFTAGLGVAALGHGRAELAQVLARQFSTLGHTSNLFANVPQLELATRLVERSFADKVWFQNSGTEANEAAIKFARLWGRAHGNKTTLIAFRGGFHGRTYGALSATYHPEYRAPFAPLVDGVRFADFNDLDSVRSLFDESVAAVLVEPVQGEGGVVPATPEFLRGLRRLCNRHDALLVFDEVQCGLGRLGTLHAYESYGVTPDMLTLAKPLAAGLPLGAVLLTNDVAQHLRPGHHGSTFAGGPAVCAVALAVLDAVSQPAFLAQVQARALALADGLAQLAESSPSFTGTRGRGLMQALVVAPGCTPADVVAGAKARGLLLTRAGDDAVRLLPPLNCSAAEVDSALTILSEVAHALAPSAAVPSHPVFVGAEARSA